MNTKLWTSDRRLYLDEDGNVVEHDNPAKVELLVGVNGTTPMERARALGLLDETKAKSDPPATKAVTKAPNTKSK